MRLHENKELFRQAIAVTSKHFKVDPSIVEKGVYRKDYKAITEQVLHEDMSYEDAIQGVQQLIDMDII